MDIIAIRLANMRSLVGQPATPTRRALAEALNISYELLSNYIGKNPVKNIGNELARRTEQALSLPHGWLDQLHSASPTAIATPLRAAENTGKPYLWPFRSVQPTQWYELDDYDRGRVEQLVITLLSEHNARKSTPVAKGG